jgi:hypothetical protein
MRKKLKGFIQHWYVFMLYASGKNKSNWDGNKEQGENIEKQGARNVPVLPGLFYTIAWRLVTASNQLVRLVRVNRRCSSRSS